MFNQLTGSEESSALSETGATVHADSAAVAQAPAQVSAPAPDPVVAAAVQAAACPLCAAQAGMFAVVSGVNYYCCNDCDFIFADPELLQRMDEGQAACEYADVYWQEELRDARERSYGSSLARAAEALLYCRIPVQRFVDIGTGPGYFLDAISGYLPSSKHKFYGVELFPPAEIFRSQHPNYRCAELSTLGLTFQCGSCVEVLEHLTPKMAAALAASMKSVSEPGSLFIFNTGLTHYVRDEDMGYLNPYARGHVTVWSVTAARKVFGPHGFAVYPLRGKSWAFVVEYVGQGPVPTEPPPGGIFRLKTPKEGLHKSP